MQDGAAGVVVGGRAYQSALLLVELEKKPAILPTPIRLVGLLRSYIAGVANHIP
jgi:hypothetical protein